MSIAAGFDADASGPSGIGRSQIRGADDGISGENSTSGMPSQGVADEGQSVFTPEDLEAHRTYLLKVANRILKPELRPRVSPSDLVQESVVVAIRKFQSFQGKSFGQMRSWLRSILKHRYGNHHKAHYGTCANRKRPAVSVDALREEIEGWEIAAREDSGSAERKRQQLDLVLAEVACLSRAEAEVFLLAIGERLPIDEIARRLGISEASARKRHSRALNRIQQRLKNVRN